MGACEEVPFACNWNPVACSSEWNAADFPLQLGGNKQAFTPQREAAGSDDDHTAASIMITITYDSCYCNFNYNISSL
ncbi:unnamed protein product [Sphagnum balticum]